MPSPFDFLSNGLLYIPERMPFPNIRDDSYIQAVMAEILQIVSATYGHTLILFYILLAHGEGVLWSEGAAF